ncbi:hypothetical protein OQA88_5385 [Cercophora sp. LCS_1]
MQPLTVPPLLSSSAFYLAAGSLTVDPSRRKVLILHDRRSNIYKLPRGHKDWSESLEAAALRETFEETGHRATLLPVAIASRATAPPSDVGIAKFDETGDVLIPGCPKLTEPFALMMHYQPDGCLAVVAWFVAVGDSESPGEVAHDEDYEGLWASYEEARERMGDSIYAQLVTHGVTLTSPPGESTQDTSNAP